MGVFGVPSTSAGVFCLAVYNGVLYAGGDFLVGAAEGPLARWNGSAWQLVRGFGAGSVEALEVYGSDLIIGGSFNINNTTHGIIKWNGSSLSEVGAGIPNAIVTKMKYRPADNSLYVGGSFSSVAGISTGNLARWDGAWHSVGGTFVANNVLALENYGNFLAIGGQ